MIDPAGKELLAKDSYEFETIAKLLENYDLGTLDKVYEIFGGYVNRSFGIECTKDGEAVDYFVRRYRDTQAESDILSEHDLITYCIGKGLDNAAGLYKNKDGKTFQWIKNEQEDKNYPWAIYRYLYGEDPYDWINTNLKPEEDASLGALQSRIHNSAYGFTGGEKEEPQIYDLLAARKDYWKHCCDDKGVDPRDRYDMCYKANIDYVLEMADKARKGLEDSGLIKDGIKTVCHCDWHPGNVKWKDGQCVGVFDFDWSKVDYRLFDICFGLVYTCTAWEALEDGIPHLDRFKLYLGGYNKYSREHGELPPFTESEQKAFPYMFLAAGIYLWNWATDYYNFPAEYDEYEWYYYLAHTLKAIKYADEHVEELYQLIKSC